MVRVECWVLESQLRQQVVTVPLPNARVSRVLRDDHYKRMSRVTVGVAR